MASAPTSAPSAIESALEFFEAECRPEEARLRDGYLDRLGSGDVAAPHLSQRLLDTKLMPVVANRRVTAIFRGETDANAAPQRQ